MNYLNNLSSRQWIIIVVIILFFAFSYFFFMKRPVDTTKVDVQKLLDQGTAPISSEENIGRDKLQKFLTPDVPVAGSSSAPKGLSNEEKSALFKLMSAPKAK